MAKFYSVEKEINGKKYVFQFNGVLAALEAVDNSYIDGTSNTSLVKLSKYLFEHVVVEPKGLTPDDFEDISEFNEVVGVARQVLQGEFRAEKDENAANAKSGK